jgi:hypothetical protein
MNADQLTASLNSKEISGFQRGPYLERLETLLRAKDAPAMPALQPDLTKMTQIPAAQLAVPVPSSESARAAEIEAEAYKPASSSDEFTSTLGPDAKPEHIAFDADLRQALHAAELPVVVGNSLINAFQQNARSLRHAEPQQIQAYITRNTKQLESAWGDQFGARVNAISDFVDQVADKSPAVSRILTNTPHLLADPVVMQQLWSVLERRGQSRK